MNITNLAKFLKRYFPIAVLVGEDDGLVDDLLQLGVLEISAHHHLEHLEELSIGYVVVLVHVVDPKRDCKPTHSIHASLHVEGDSSHLIHL